MALPGPTVGAHPTPPPGMPPHTRRARQERVCSAVPGEMNAKKNVRKFC